MQSLEVNCIPCQEENLVERAKVSGIITSPSWVGTALVHNQHKRAKRESSD